MKRFALALLSAFTLVTQGCDCGAKPGTDGGVGGGSVGGGGGVTGGGTGGGVTGGGTGGGATGGGTGGGATGGGTGGGATGGGAGGGTGGGAAASVRPAKDIVAGGGRMTGGNFVMNAQVGQGTPQAPATGGGRVIQGNTAIKR